MNATVDTVIEHDEPTGETAPPPRRRLRRALLATRTIVVVLILLAAAVAGGNHIVRQRIADRAMVDAGTAVLTAEPITVGSADAAVVTKVLATERTSVTAGTPLAAIALTADGDGPRTRELRAPAAGIVTEINVAPGQIARAGEPIVTLYDPAALAFRVDVPLEQLRRLRLGMTAYVSGPGLGGRIATTLQKVEPRVASSPAAQPDRLTVVLRPDPAALATVRTLVPGLQFAVVVDTTTAAAGTPAVNSA
ncbi:HlyD family efflux transporter periplasmic adaptor subunit [Actinoplanes sp. NPDC051513]|uniref:HlyD family efflux transporter periplasmic adaptor subunit n=1 Tax=Actinoplanes sp. NPDC051513 TaxID=3363908 RepID=UPI0037AAD662